MTYININIDLIENKIYLNSNKKLENIRIVIYSWNPYNNDEIIIYSDLTSINKNVFYWYSPASIMKNFYGIKVKIFENENLLLKEEKFRLRSRYNNLIKKQAVVSWSDAGLGDNLFCTPIIKKLYDTYNQKITLYTFFPEIFINSPYIEKVIQISDIQNLNIDTNVYEVHNLGHSQIKPFNIYDKNCPDIIGQYSHHIGMNLNSDEKRIEFFPDDYNIPQLPKNYIVINTNETHGPRTWGVEKYNKLIKLLEYNNIYVVALGKDCNYGPNQDIKKALQGIEISYGLNLINKTTLSQAWHIINNSSGFVSHTSGLFHLAMSTNALIFELGCNCYFSNWITRDKKNIEIEGQCKLHCYDNLWCCVSEHSTINQYMPTYQCHLQLPTYECHPTPEQVFENVKNNITSINYKFNVKFDDHSTIVENYSTENYYVKFIDNNNVIKYESNLFANCWSCCNSWIFEIKIFDKENHLIFRELNNNTEKNVFNILNDVYFSTKYDGFFIECGAFDGITNSCCINFEKQKNWTGINIEAQIKEYEKLIINRPKCTNLNFALYNEDNIKLKMKLEGENSSLLSTDQEINIQEVNIQEVNTISWKKLIKDYNISKIDVLCLDIEGAEKYILADMIDAEIVPDVICIEVAYVIDREIKSNWQELRELLKKIGYKLDFYHFNNAYCSKPGIHPNNINKYFQDEWYQDNKLIYKYDEFYKINK